ncbi:MAG: four helix bundle protein [Patescibacteria group bacterium]
MKLWELKVYHIAREISKYAWPIYKRLDWQMKKIIGDQWIEAIDSISANIAEGFGRFHFLDKNKFNYNARGSLFESFDWVDKLFERKEITKEEYDYLISKLALCHKKLNSYIQTTKSQIKK